MRSQKKRRLPRLPFVLFLAAAALMARAGVRFAPLQLPPSAWADTEVSTNLVFDSGATDLISTTRGDPLFAFTVVEPAGYRVNFITISNGTQVVGEAGDFSVIYDLTLLPDAVSFSNIELKEVGVLTTDATGYFSEPAHSNLLHHTAHYGADVWNEVGSISNSVVDTATVVELLPPWQDGGEMTWPIPNVYRKAGTTDEGCRFCNTDQNIILTQDGTVQLGKFGCFTVATTNRYISTWRAVE